MGGTGGKRGKGGNASQKRKRATETPAQEVTRREKRNERRRTLLCVQGATHRLNRVIHGTDEAEESVMVDKKCELDWFFAALVKTGGVLAQ